MSRRNKKTWNKTQTIQNSTCLTIRSSFEGWILFLKGTKSEVLSRKTTSRSSSCGQVGPVSLVWSKRVVLCRWENWMFRYCVTSRQNRQDCRLTKTQFCVVPLARSCVNVLQDSIKIASCKKKHKFQSEKFETCPHQSAWVAEWIRGRPPNQLKKLFCIVYSLLDGCCFCTRFNCFFWICSYFFLCFYQLSKGKGKEGKDKGKGKNSNKGKDFFQLGPILFTLFHFSTTSFGQPPSG